MKCSRIVGKSAATTGTPTATYSNSLVESAKRKPGRQVGDNPDRRRPDAGEDLLLGEESTTQRHAVDDPQLCGELADARQGVAVAVDLESSVVCVVDDPRDGLDEEVDAVVWSDSAVVDDAEAMGAGVRASGEQALVDRIHDDDDLLEGHASRDELPAVRLVNRDDRVGEAGRGALDHAQHPVGQVGSSASAEPHREHVRRQIVDVEDHPRTEELRDDRGRRENPGDRRRAPRRSGGGPQAAQRGPTRGR